MNIIKYYNLWIIILITIHSCAPSAAIVNHIDNVHFFFKIAEEREKYVIRN